MKENGTKGAGSSKQADANVKGIDKLEEGKKKLSVQSSQSSRLHSQYVSSKHRSRHKNRKTG